MTSITRGTTPDGREAWIVRKHGQVNSLMSDKRLSMQPPNTQVSSWFADSPMHRVLLRLADRAVPTGESDHEERARRRVTMSKMFKPSNIHRTLPDVRAYADELLDGILAEGPPADLLGVTNDDIPLFRQWASDKESRDFKRAAIALRQLSNYVKDLIAKRTEEPGDDIVSALLASEAPDEMHIGRTANLVVWILGLGWQVSAAAIDYGLMLLLTNPDQRKLLEDDPSLIDSATEEVLRHFNPTPRGIGGTDRYAEVDFEYDGIEIKKGDMIVLNVVAANHDPDVFERPAEFDIRRTDNRHLTFGQGFYYCNFNQVARSEIVIGIQSVLRRMPNLALAVPVEELKEIVYPPTAFETFPITW
jgi:cytochrome P450